MWSFDLHVCMHVHLRHVFIYLFNHYMFLVVTVNLTSYRLFLQLYLTTTASPHNKSVTRLNKVQRHEQSFAHTKTKGSPGVRETGSLATRAQQTQPKHAHASPVHLCTIVWAGRITVCLLEDAARGRSPLDLAFRPRALLKHNTETEVFGQCWRELFTQLCFYIFLKKISNIKTEKEKHRRSKKNSKKNFITSWPDLLTNTESVSD